MATSKCCKCDGTQFENKEALPKHANFKVIFVQCAVLWRNCHKPKKTQKRGLSGFASNRKRAILRFGRGIK